MMQIQGQAGGPVRPPLADLNAAEREELRAMMNVWEPWL
jgi:dihydrodipicolinate synthase/N-acetylneuraminate lyase